MKLFILKYRVILLTLVLIGMMLGYIVPNYHHQGADKNVAAIIQKQLQTDQILLKEIMLDLREVLITNGKKAYERRSLDYQEKYGDRFAFFLYSNHKLDLWSDNHIPFPINEQLLSNDEFQHLGSYEVLITPDSFRNLAIYGVQIINFEYPWQNDYLHNHIATYFKTSARFTIDDKEGLPILNSKGHVLFYIQSIDLKPSNDLVALPFLLFLLSFFLLVYLLKTVLKNKQKSNSVIALVLFILGVLFWFGLHIFLSVPSSVFQSLLFSSSLYANSHIQQSLGHLFFSSLALLVIIVYYYSNQWERKVSGYWFYLYLSFIYFLFLCIVVLLRSLVFDSQISMNLYHIASLNMYSYIALGILFILQFVWFLLTDRWLDYFIPNRNSEWKLWLFITMLSLLSYIIVPIFFMDNWVFYLYLNGFILIMFYIKKHDQSRSRVGELFIYLIFFTLITSWQLNSLNQVKEMKLRQTKALGFNLENDPFLETEFIYAAQSIAKNKDIKAVLINNQIDHVDDTLFNIITKTYFSDFLSTYNINLIFCDRNSLINIMPENIETPCFEYFETRIQQAQNIISQDTFYLMDGSFQSYHYIGELQLNFETLPPRKIFIEFVSTAKPKEMGLPALLEKSRSKHNSMLKNYSYAVYHEGILVEWFGKYDYKQKLNDYRVEFLDNYFFEKDHYSHYIYATGKDNIMISAPEPGTLQMFASYAFVFLLFSFLAFIIYSLVFTNALNSSIHSFQGRLQYSMIFLLLFSFFLVGITSLYYIYYLNQNKNEDLLMEKAHSVLIELEHKISSIHDFQPEDQAYVESLLMKFSEVFFTDITLYTQDGKLLASSRPEIFNASLLSKTMDAEAYFELKSLKNSYFIQDEKIGTQSYLSAYLPFRNQDNQSVAYLNLPYFAKQYQLEEEVSGFIVAFLNIYLLLLFITIIITIIISRYLSKPIHLIRSKMQHLDLELKNAKIEWDRDDEIGELVKEYNRMVDELSLSAQKLAYTQRESAWREMAQQIAHEIKNPLTPMMLNVQYLQKAWADRADDYEARMLRITNALTEQIEVLSDIAGQFGTFAAIEKTALENLNMKDIVIDVLAIFKANEHISFNLQIKENDYFITADKSQIIRILNNIYKNAIQAIGDAKNGHIITELNRIEQALQIVIRDNGCGMNTEELPSIFEPHFTTKTSGMGLGLALVKKMLENINASISVESSKGQGSSFIIIIPIIDKVNYDMDST